MRLSLLFWLMMNAGVYVTLRANMPGASSRLFTTVFWSFASLALVPWVSVAFLGWRAMMGGLGALSDLFWGVSIAWNVAVLVVMVFWIVWRPMVTALKRHSEKPGVDEKRRALLQKLGWVVPAGAVATGTAGVIAAGFRPYVRKVTLHYKGLHPSLEGFKIGQFSDVHVGPFIAPSHVEAGIEALNNEHVDVMVMTGDLLDDVTFMPAINAAFRQCKARHGLIGIVGNHEYYAGLHEYMRHVVQGPMKMLVDDGMVIEHGDATVHVAGLDYPFGGMDGPAEKVASSLDDAMKDMPADVDFKLCLAHHPTCWDAARVRGVQLTLSGHTHGGQVAVGGRSLFSKVFRYMLGLYEDGESKLFVTGGLGHWFPFRLGCPPEVVVVELRRADAAA